MRKIAMKEPPGSPQADKGNVPARQEADQVSILLGLVDRQLKQANLVEARALCQAALSVAENLFGPDSVKARQVLSRLAELFFIEEDYSHCENVCLRLLQAQSQV